MPKPWQVRLGIQSGSLRQPIALPNLESRKTERPASRLGSAAIRQPRTRLQPCKLCSASARQRSYRSSLFFVSGERLGSRCGCSSTGGPNEFTHSLSDITHSLETNPLVHGSHRSKTSIRASPLQWARPYGAKRRWTREPSGKQNGKSPPILFPADTSSQGFIDRELRIVGSATVTVTNGNQSLVISYRLDRTSKVVASGIAGAENVTLESSG